jgi:hypothetical protein
MEDERGWAEVPVMDDERVLEHEEKTTADEDDFPLDFEDDDICPVCLDDTYPQDKCLLQLPCGHTLCKACLKGIINCPKCRKRIVKSFIRRKQLEEKK